MGIGLLVNEYIWSDLWWNGFLRVDFYNGFNVDMFWYSEKCYSVGFILGNLIVILVWFRE